MDGAMFQTLQCVLVGNHHIYKQHAYLIVDDYLLYWNYLFDFPFFFFFESLFGHIAPGGPLVVLKEAVDDAEEESKAGKTEIEKCINHENVMDFVTK